MLTTLLRWAALGAATLQVAPQAVPAGRQADHIGIVSIHGEVDSLTAESVSRRVDEAVRDGCDAIVLELNTPGGDAMETLALCQEIKGAFPAATVAWVRPHAYSAGAIIALACREIVVAPGGAFGDAAPIAALPGVGLIPLPPTERAKLESPILAEVIDSARRRRYDEALVASFIRLGSPLWLIERRDGSARAVVDAEEYRRVFGDDPTQAATVLSPEVLTDPAAGPLQPLIQSLFSQPSGGDSSGTDLLPEVQVRRTRAALTATDAAQWRLVGQVVRPDALLVVHSPEARALGLAGAEVADEQALQAWFGASDVRRYDSNWSEAVARFLMTWPARIVLIVIMLVAFFIEVAIPGTTWFGITALVALGLLVGAPAVAGAAQWWEVGAILLGLLLLAAEVLLLPGTGIAAVLGGLLLLAGLVGSFVGDDVSTPAGRAEALRATGLVLVAFVLSGVGMWAAGRFLPRSRVMGQFVLATVAADAPAGPPAPALGALCTAATALRPTGRISHGERIMEARSAGEFIETGRTVRVVGFHEGVPEVEEVVG